MLGGVLGDRYGKRAVLAAGFALFVWTMVVSAFTTSYTVVLFINLYQCVCNGILFDALSFRLHGAHDSHKSGVSLTAGAWSVVCWGHRSMH